MRSENTRGRVGYIGLESAAQRLSQICPSCRQATTRFGPRYPRLHVCHSGAALVSEPIVETLFLSINPVLQSMTPLRIASHSHRRRRWSGRRHCNMMIIRIKVVGKYCACQLNLFGYFQQEIHLYDPVESAGCGAANLHGRLRLWASCGAPRTRKRPLAQTIAAKLSRKAARVASMSASLWAREVKPAS